MARIYRLARCLPGNGLDEFVYSQMPGVKRLWRLYYIEHELRSTP